MAASRKHGPHQLTYPAQLCMPHESVFSLTYGARAPDDVDQTVATCLPIVKRARLALQAAEAEMEDWQSTRCPAGTFVCEKCAAECTTAHLMYPLPQFYGGTGSHTCVCWPRWCDACVCTYQPACCPGEGCGISVRWAGGQKFFIHVMVMKQKDKSERMELDTEFVLFADPAVATLRSIKNQVLVKAKVPIADQIYKLKGVDKTLTELGLVQGAVVNVVYKATA